MNEVTPNVISTLESLIAASEYGAELESILDSYIDLALQLPEFRSNPEMMEAKVKAISDLGTEDVATQADIYTQDQIKTRVVDSHTDWQFWGEEGSDNTSEYDASKTYLLITDPIEGTNNFRRGNDDQWGSVISLVDIKTKTPVIGIVAHPTERTFYIGVKGLGAYKLVIDGNQKMFNKVEARDLEPGKDCFTYNFSPHFEPHLVEQAKRFAGKDDLQERERLIKQKEDDEVVFEDPESGALEGVRYRGGFCFKTSNEMAAVFVFVNELGGMVTDGQGNDWHLGINTLVWGRTQEDYEFALAEYQRSLVD